MNVSAFVLKTLQNQEQMIEHLSQESLILPKK